jgi:hypothetical protein
MDEEARNPGAARQRTTADTLGGADAEARRDPRGDLKGVHRAAVLGGDELGGDELDGDVLDGDVLDGDVLGGGKLGGDVLGDSMLNHNELDEREAPDEFDELDDLEGLLERLDTPGPAARTSNAPSTFAVGSTNEFQAGPHPRGDASGPRGEPFGGGGLGSAAPTRVGSTRRPVNSVLRAYIVLSLALLILSEPLIDALTRSGPLGAPARWLLLALQHPVRSPLAVLLLALALRPSPPGGAPHAGPKHGAGL